ncbi:MAG: hypothetical protein ACTSVI_07995 [Promethearchaeota archaeon]
MVNKYGGNSPWIGSEASINKFIDIHGNKIDVIAITHAHLDHFDPLSLNEVFNANPNLELIAPFPVINIIYESSIFNETITNFSLPVQCQTLCLSNIMVQKATVEGYMKKIRKRSIMPCLLIQIPRARALLEKFDRWWMTCSKPRKNGSHH